MAQVMSRHRPGTRGAVLPLGVGLVHGGGEEQAVKEVDDRREEVREKPPQQDGGQGVQQLFQQGDEGPAAEKRIVKDQNGADRQDRRQRRLSIDPLLLHRQPSFAVKSLTLSSFYTAPAGIAILSSLCYSSLYKALIQNTKLF